MQRYYMKVENQSTEAYLFFTRVTFLPKKLSYFYFLRNVMTEISGHAPKR